MDTHVLNRQGKEIFHTILIKENWKGRYCNVFFKCLCCLPSSQLLVVKVQFVHTLCTAAVHFRTSDMWEEQY